MKKCTPLESHLGYWLRYVSNHVSSSFEKKLAKQGISVAEWVVLRLLYDENMLSPGSLAKKIGMTRGAMSKLLNRLIDKNLVEREEAENDRRFQEIKLSKKGQLLVPQLTGLADQNDEYFFGHLSDERKEQLLKILKEIISLQNLNQIPIN